MKKCKVCGQTGPHFCITSSKRKKLFSFLNNTERKIKQKMKEVKI